MKSFEKKIASSAFRNKSNLIFYIVAVALPVLQFLIFYIGVNFNSITLAFKHYNADGTYSVVWFENIVQVIKDFGNMPTLQYALRNSFSAYFASLLIGTTLALLFSYYIFKKFPLSKTFRVFLFLPQIISAVVMVLLYSYMVSEFLPEVANKLFHIEMKGLLDDPKTRFGTLVFYYLWVGFGTSTLLYSGAMNNISESIMEAAKIDGAGFFVEFFRIVFPLIFPTFVTFIVAGLASLFSAQLELYSFYADAAEFEVYTVGYYMYVETLKATTARYPYLSAMGMTITLIVAPIALVVRWLLEKFGPSVER